ncbi:hypothetical protein KIH86_02760 [Paenibacillus sp. HN-1]|uniref:pectin acetylesterase-family hydrolase n=1 Tax=Paenibacillus TaxID=44249 RepID=UPI001CAA2AFC|nr:MULTISPECIES: pectin acetylesterase-family hydrolase [Paenibacillus]MBY9078340.1 hypothetical protein [Paenibacillus sp. CGMCC 1.18879]MBY9083152.1 hypothetical protein [Paenibacillus sinensis]
MSEELDALKKKIAEKQLPVLDSEPLTGAWYKVPVPDAVCAGGTPYYGYMRKGTEPNLIVCFSGGGVSVNNYTAARPIHWDSGDREAFYMDDKALPLLDIVTMNGLCSDNQENPFRNWSIIAVNYVSGDFHVGQADFHYTDLEGSPAVLHHHGYLNYRGLMEQAIQHLPKPEKLLVTGDSAGAFATSALTSDVMSFFPECHDVTCCPDSCMLFFDDWQAAARDVWQANERIWGPLQSSNIVLDWLRALYLEKGENIRYLFTCSTRDSELAKYQHYFSHGSQQLVKEQNLQFETDLKVMIDTLKAEIPSIGLFLFDFPNPDIDPALLGTQHTLIRSPRFSVPASHGISLQQWMWEAVNGMVSDVGLELLNK